MINNYVWDKGEDFNMPFIRLELALIVLTQKRSCWADAQLVSMIFFEILPQETSRLCTPSLYHSILFWYREPSNFFFNKPAKLSQEGKSQADHFEISIYGAATWWLLQFKCGIWTIVMLSVLFLSWKLFCFPLSSYQVAAFSRDCLFEKAAETFDHDEK